MFDRARKEGGVRWDAREVLLIDASRDYQSGKNQTTLLDAHLTRILDTFRTRTTIDKYAHLASVEEIAENDFNLKKACLKELGL